MRTFSSHDVQIKSISVHLQRKVFFFLITCWTRHYFAIFIIYCSVSVRIEKMISIDLLGIIRWFKRWNTPSLMRKTFFSIFMMRRSLLLIHFWKAKPFFFFTPFWNDCEMFIVTRSTYTTRQTRSITEKHCDHLLIFLVTLEAIRRNRHLSRVERPKIFRNKQKLRARNIR